MLDEIILLNYINKDPKLKELAYRAAKNSFNLADLIQYCKKHYKEEPEELALSLVHLVKTLLLPENIQ